MADLSAFADACIDCSLSVLYNLHCRVDGIPRAKNGSRQRLTVFGLGKLGGKELNFSSDVDLIFAYPEAGKPIILKNPAPMMHSLSGLPEISLKPFLKSPLMARFSGSICG